MAYSDTLKIVLALAARDLAVFPCRANKPACPHGFKPASRVPDTLCEPWHQLAIPLIGISTGDLQTLRIRTRAQGKIAYRWADRSARELPRIGQVAP